MTGDAAAHAITGKEAKTAEHGMLRIIQNQVPASAKSYYSAGAYYSEGQGVAYPQATGAKRSLGAPGGECRCAVNRIAMFIPAGPRLRSLPGTSNNS